MATVVHMVGNAHVDPIWLWPWTAGVDEALATFRSAADRCDEYPEFVFTRGEAWLYRWVARLDPALSGRVDELVARGQWHVTGGMVVQPDANLPSEAGWRRQVRHGRRYFSERFGVAPSVGYNVDTFGHPASLPDLLCTEGFDSYVFHRPQPGQVPLPAAAFRWRGTGGAELLACRIVPGYVTRGGDLREQVLRALEASDPAVGHALCFYGVGDHGGGPTRANVEWILEHAHDLAGAELRFSTPRAFFDAIADRRSLLPEVSVELQHTFPGCYSVMHDVKRAQRRTELALDAAERAIDALAADPDERAGMHARLDAAWDDLLFCQFHDVLAGTSIPSAWPAVRALQGRAAIAGEELVVEATRRHAVRTFGPAPFQRLAVVNAHDEPWSGLVEAEPAIDFDEWGARWLSDAAGAAIPFQLIQPEAQALTTRLLAPVAAGPGETVPLLVRGDPPGAPAAAPDDVHADARVLANARLRVELADGGIARVLLDGEPLVGAIGLHLRHDASDTWTWDSDRFEEPVASRLAGGEWAVDETGPLRGRVRLEARLGDSRLRWTLALHAGEPCLRMLLEVLWAERLRLLQLAVELPGAAGEHVDGLPGGTVAREPGAVEWPVCGWSRVRAGGAAGAHVALVTPDAYSVSLDGDRWQWTLLRSPKMAWGGGRPAVYGGRDVFADQGSHSFELDLHAGEELAPATLERLARRQCQPPVIVEWTEGMERPQWGAGEPAQEPQLFAPIARRPAEPPHYTS